MTVHLVNLTNPMMMKGPFRELMPVGQQVVRVKLPEGTEVKGVRLLCAEQESIAKENDGYLTVVVPGILDHEVVAIDRLPQADAEVEGDPNVRWFQIDLTDADAVGEVFGEVRRSGGAEAVVHLAAYYDFTG